MLRVRMDLQKARLASKPMPTRRQLPDEHRLNFLKTPWSSHTGNMVSDFYDNRLFAGAYPNLLPHARGGHMDDRKRKLDAT